MSQIRSKDTSIELMLRKALWRKGLRYKIHYSILGKPDIVFTKKKVAIFCDSDFWHGYDWMGRKERLKSNLSYWIPKIERNMRRDKEVTKSLRRQGWAVIRFWEHELRKDLDSCVGNVLKALGGRAVD